MRRALPALAALTLLAGCTTAPAPARDAEATTTAAPAPTTTAAPTLRDRTLLGAYYYLWNPENLAQGWLRNRLVPPQRARIASRERHRPLLEVHQHRRGHRQPHRARRPHRRGGIEQVHLEPPLPQRPRELRRARRPLPHPHAPQHPPPHRLLRPAAR